MLELKVKRILLENRYSGLKPTNMTQLAAACEISDKHLRTLLRRGRADDVGRVAHGLGVDPSYLS